MSAMEPDTPAPDPITERRDALSNRLDAASTDMAELCTIYLGERLGYYQTLAADGPLTSSELATRTATNARYAREWLEQQTVAGFLAVEDPALAPPSAGSSCLLVTLTFWPTRRVGPIGEAVSGSRLA